jgi:RHS repeat-associated protein
LSYDYENRLIDYQNGSFSGAKVAYTYDYRTRRVVSNEYAGIFPAAPPYSPNNVKFVFSGGTSVAEYSSGSSTAQVTYIRGSDYGGGVGGILYSIRPSAGASFNHYNGRGDLVSKTDSSGALTYQQDYLAFGNKAASTGYSNDRQGANTKDVEVTGLINDGFRMRDADTGTFITRDPAGFVNGPNLYTYVNQNPWTKFDPEGLWFGADDAIAAGGGALISVGIQGLADLWHGHLSSYKDYAAAAVGGAAAGEAGLYSGGLASGAAYGAASNLTKQGLNNLDGTQHGLNVKSLAADTAVGAVAGKVGEIVAPAVVAGAKHVINSVTKSASAEVAESTVEAATSVDLRLKYKKEWTPEQRAAADAKAKALTEADTTVVKSPVREGTAQSRYRKEAKLDSATDADHIHDLQLGGADTIENMQGLNKSVNRSLGSQIQSKIKDLPEGTRIDRVTMHDEE